MTFHADYAKYVPGSYPTRAASALEMVEKHLREWNRQRQKLLSGQAKPEPPPLSICFSRKIGTGALEVADIVAAKLGYRVFDREVLEHIAADRQLSEKSVALFDERYPGRITEFMAYLAGEKSFIKSDYLRTLHKVIVSVAGLGPTIFVGRGAHLILPRDRVLAVRFISSLEYRIRRLADMLDVNADAAAKLIADLDKEQRSYFKQAFGKRDASPYEFDLVINRDFIDNARWAADIVVLAYRRRPAGRAEASPKTAETGVPA